MDDPTFLPETALPALDFDLSGLERSLAGDSLRSSQSMMSIHGHSQDNPTPHPVGVIQLPSSSTRSEPYQLLLDDQFIDSAQRQFDGAGKGPFDDEGEYFQDDMIFEFDGNGEMRDIDVGEREARGTGSRRIRKGDEDAAACPSIPIMDEGDFDIANFYDSGQGLPDAEAFPMMSGALGGNDQPQDQLPSEDRVYEESSIPVSSNTVDALLNARKTRSRKPFVADRIVELRNADLILWQNEYKSNMVSAILLALQRKANVQAKKNAFWLICGAGLNGVGYGVGTAKLLSPLDMFSGAHLFSQIISKATPSNVSKLKKTKRTIDIDSEEQVTPKRSRQGEVDNEIRYGNFEDAQGIPIMEDGSMGIEIGLDAASALPDHPSFAMMPWNVSASLNSYQRAASSSHHGRGVGSAGCRLPSTSPLVGRGSTLPGPLEQFSLEEDEIMYGREESFDRGLEPSKSQAEFEIFGLATQVDAQTAADSQWVRDALAREADNFFEFVLNTISEKAGDELGEDNIHVANEMTGKFVTFDELFDPTHISRAVAAQAFYHVLSLATKNRVGVEQDNGIELFGSIRITVIG